MVASGQILPTGERLRSGASKEETMLVRIQVAGRGSVASAHYALK